MFPALHTALTTNDDSELNEVGLPKSRPGPREAWHERQNGRITSLWNGASANAPEPAPERPVASRQADGGKPAISLP